MRVESKPGVKALARSARPQGTGLFALDAHDAAAPAGGGAVQVRAATNLDSIIALQTEMETATQRRRAARRGHQILDALDGLRLRILTGRIGEADLLPVRQLLAQSQPVSGDPDLTEALSHIELRAAVELAKARLRSENP